MSNEPPFDDPYASPEAFFAAYPGTGPMPSDPHERVTLHSLAEQTSDPPGHISQPSAEYDHYLETGKGLERATDPPRHEERDTERPPAGETTLPRPTPRPEDPDELMPRRQLNATLDRLESLAKQAKDAAQLCFNEVQQVRQVLSLLPCMKEEAPGPKCPSLVPAE